MKNLLLLLMSIGFCSMSAQSQNTFPGSGNVGIGTTSPAEKLTIVSASNSTGFMHTNGVIKLSTYITTRGAYFGTTTNHPLYFRTNNAGAQITLLQNGRVGIGTALPAGKLEVLGEDAYIQHIRIGVGRATGNGMDSSNTAVGRNALQNNDPRVVSTRGGEMEVGVANTAIGLNTLSSNVSGYENTATGAYAMPVNDQGYRNTVMGAYAMYKNTYGGINVAIGNSTLWSNVNGFKNTAVGGQCMQYNSSGTANSGFGMAALFANEIGGYNTACGAEALFNMKDGSNNSALGYHADINATGLSNTTVIGSNALGTASNQVRIGNSAVTSIGGWTNWTNISDGRVKKNIRENVPGLGFINLLKPVTYNLDLQAADKITKPSALIGSASKEGRPARDLDDVKRKKESVIYSGFIAQDVAKAAQSLNYDFSGVDVSKNDSDLYGIRYAEFVVPLVKSVQELSSKNEELQKQVSELQQLVAVINKKLDDKENTMVQNSHVLPASLQQNLPNPFNNATSISYKLPEQNVTAKIIVTDKKGAKIKEVIVSGTGNGTIHLNTSVLSAGTYQYSLYVNDRLIETKQMILSR